MIAVISIATWWLFLLGTFFVADARMWLWKRVLIPLVLLTSAFASLHYARILYPFCSLTEDVLMRVGPDESYGCLAALHRNDEVMVYSSQNGWSKIKNKNTIGWVPHSLLQPIAH
jgi:uncharacterized protein YraI